MTTPNPISGYKKSEMEGLTNLIAQAATEADSPGAGNTVNRSTSTVHNEGKSIHNNAATIYDVIAPQVTVNCNQHLIQAKNKHEQVFHSQQTNVYNWTRAQSMAVVQSDNIYNYSADRCYVTAGRSFQQSSSQSVYADVYNLQVGQDSKVPLVGTSAGPAYGSLSLGAINNVTVASKEGAISISGNKGIVAKSDRDCVISADNTTVVTGKAGVTVRSDAQASVSALGPTSISSSSLLSLSSTGAMYISASMIFAGMGPGGIKPSVNLDAVTGTLGTLTGAVAGGPFTINSALGLASAVASGNITGAVMMIPGLENGLFNNLISSQDIGSLLSGDISSLVGGLTGKVGGFVGDKIKGLFDPKALVDKLPGLRSIPGVSDLLQSELTGALDSVIPGIFSSSYGGFVYRTYKPIKPPAPLTSVPLPENIGAYTDGAVTEAVFPTTIPVGGQPTLIR